MARKVTRTKIRLNLMVRGMNNALLPQLDGATALSDEDLEGRIPSYIALRSELNEAEQANILDRQRW